MESFQSHRCSSKAPSSLGYPSIIDPDERKSIENTRKGRLDFPFLITPSQRTKGSDDLPPWKAITWKDVVSFWTGLLAQLIAGALYSFSSYSSDLQTLLDISMSDIDLMGELGNLGQYVGPVAGILYYVCGVKITTAVAGFFMFLGYFLIYFGVKSASILSSVGGLGFCFFLAGLGSQFLSVAAYTSAVQNMPPQYRGLVIGSQFAFLSISSAIFGGIYRLLFVTATLRYHFLVLAILSPLGALLSVWLLLPDPDAAPISKPCKCCCPDEHSTHASGISKRSGQSSISSMVAIQKPNCSKIVWEVLVLLVQSPLWWAIFVIFFVEQGVILVLVINTGNLIKSLNENTLDSTSYVVNAFLYAIFSSFARILFGVTDRVRVKRGWMLFIALLILSLAQIIAATSLVVNNFERLYIVTAVSAVGSGLSDTALATIVSETWGPHLFPQTWGWTILSAAPATFAFNGIASALYSHAIDIHDSTGVPRPTDDNMNALERCVGADCFRTTFYLMAGICLFAALISLMIVPSTEYGRKEVRISNALHGEYKHLIRSSTVGSTSLRTSAI